MSINIDITVYDVSDFAEELDLTATPEVQIEQIKGLIGRLADEASDHVNELVCIPADMELTEEVEQLLDLARQIDGLHRYIRVLRRVILDNACLAWDAANTALEADPGNEQLQAAAAAAEVAHDLAHDQIDY